MALPATDTFAGANGSPIGANWTDLDGGFEIDTNAAKGTDSGWNFTYWDADTFADNQYAQGAFINFAGVFSGPAVRAAATRCYYAMVTSSTEIALARLDAAASSTTLQTIGSLSISSGDLIRIEAEGSTLRVFLNGVQVGTDQTDATYSSGSAGIVTFSPNAGLDNFEAGNLGGGGNRRRRLLLCGSR
jgi:hypothetical protein